MSGADSEANEADSIGKASEMAEIHGKHPFNRRALLGAGIGGAGLLATGCSLFDSGSSGGGGSGEGGGGPAITIARTSDIDSLDPHYVNSSMYILPASMMEGLVMQDEAGSDVVRALAESWEVSEDELTYTFHLRSATWSNGDPITAEDAILSFQRLLSPTGAGSGYTTGASSYLPSARIRGAAEFQAGALDSWDEVGHQRPGRVDRRHRAGEPEPGSPAEHDPLLDVDPAPCLGRRGADELDPARELGWQRPLCADRLGPRTRPWR